jgi:hypothetical protein
MLRFLAWFGIALACVAAAIDVHQQNERARYWESVRADIRAHPVHCGQMTPEEALEQQQQACDELLGKPVTKGGAADKYRYCPKDILCPGPSRK